VTDEAAGSGGLIFGQELCQVGGSSRLGQKSAEMQKGHSGKPLAEVPSRERPFARHFVWHEIEQPLCHLSTVENKGLAMVKALQNR